MSYRPHRQVPSERQTQSRRRSATELFRSINSRGTHHSEPADHGAIERVIQSQGHRVSHTYTHTHNHFRALWTLSGTTRVSSYQKVHFAIFWIFWCKMKITQTDAPTIRMDCHHIQTNSCPHLSHPHHFYTGTTLPIYPGSGQAPNMLAYIPGKLSMS